MIMIMTGTMMDMRTSCLASAMSKCVMAATSSNLNIMRITIEQVKKSQRTSFNDSP